MKNVGTRFIIFLKCYDLVSTFIFVDMILYVKAGFI